jgi:hypothetical protein
VLFTWSRLKAPPPLAKREENCDAGFQKSGRVLVFEDDNHVEHRVEPMSLMAATGDIKKRLLAYQRNFVEALLSNFDKRLKITRVAILLRAIFDFRRMPLQDTPAAHEKLLVWGDTELNEMCQTYFPELDSAVVLDEALAMRLYVRDNHDIFMQGSQRHE